MAKFFKNLFSHGTLTADKKKYSKSKPELMTEDDDKEVVPNYDTRRKMSVSRSGRMKQNLKARGALGNDLYGNESKVEKTCIEYHVHGKSYLQGQAISADSSHIQKSQELVGIQNSQDLGLRSTNNNTENSNEKERKRKESKSKDEDEKFNDETELDKEIGQIFNNVLKETSF